MNIGKLISSIEHAKKSIEFGMTRECILEYFDTLLGALEENKKEKEGEKKEVEKIIEDVFYWFRVNRRTAHGDVNALDDCVKETTISRICKLNKLKEDK